MSVKLLLHGWTLAEGPMIRLLSKHSVLFAVYGSARRLPITRENDAADQR